MWKIASKSFSGSISEPKSCLHAKISVKTGFRPQKLDLKKNYFCSDFQFEVVQIRGVLHFLGGSDTVYGSRLPGHFSTKLRSPGRNLFYLGLVIIVTEVSF